MLQHRSSFVGQGRVGVCEQPKQNMKGVSASPHCQCECGSVVVAASTTVIAACWTSLPEPKSAQRKVAPHEGSELCPLCKRRVPTTNKRWGVGMEVDLVQASTRMQPMQRLRQMKALHRSNTCHAG